MFGIPLMIIVLNTLNKLFLEKIRDVTSTCSDFMLYTSKYIISCL
ncbi:unnamed protein product [Enterobius vermicularis]|uniref:G_PROTEIN_RECEP_F1_2 domain-containing protein n=1 Tax=Enterobius vermicularis TaxID=51028 RepID=A0A0N4V5E0_ENTVE|nr:unnamed protein product [Enterobius vermicularis]